MGKTYNEFIQKILSTRGRFAIKEGYKERHHIIPKCMGGSNAEENLIDLTGQEHFIAHKLLYLENPQNLALASAWYMMSNVKSDGQQRTERLTAEEYEELRIKASEHSHIVLSGKHRTEEQKEHYRLSKLGDKNPMKNMCGENHPNHGKKCYTSPDGKTSSYFYPGEEPEGWTVGMHYNLTVDRTGKNNGAYARHWYNDGCVKVYTYSCPEGFMPGMGDRSKYKLIRDNELQQYLDKKGKTLLNQ